MKSDYSVTIMVYIELIIVKSKLNQYRNMIQHNASNKSDIYKNKN